MIHSWCRRMPTAESRNPPEKHSAATNIDLRGPTRSTQRQNRAAEAPRNTMAREKTQPISFKFQSCGEDCVNPISFVSGRLKVEKAYAWPMERCTARAAGGTKKRLKPGPAMVLSRSKNDDITSPVLFMVCCGAKYICQAAPNMLHFQRSCHSSRSQGGEKACDLDHIRPASGRRFTSWVRRS